MYLHSQSQHVLSPPWNPVALPVGTLCYDLMLQPELRVGWAALWPQ